MPQIDIADLIASLPTLIFRPAGEAPVASGWCLVAPADAEWCIACREERGWCGAHGMLIDEPLVFAALPPPPGRHSPRMIKELAAWVTDAIDDADYATAAKAIDELADAVRTVRDTKPGS